MHPSSVLQVVSVNVGLPRAVVWKGRTVVTGIFKEPMAGRVAIRRLNLQVSLRQTKPGEVSHMEKVPIDRRAEITPE